MAVGNGRKSDDLGDDSLEAPAEVADPLLWRSAQRVLASHSADPPGAPCPACGVVSPCPPRQLAERAMAVARDAALPAGPSQFPASSGGPAPANPGPGGDTPPETDAEIQAESDPGRPEPASAAVATRPEADQRSAAEDGDGPEAEGQAHPGAATLPRPRATGAKGRRPSPRPRPVTA